MRTPDDWMPTDAEMLDWAFANGTRLHLLADAYAWRHGTPELVRAALTLAMREDRRWAGALPAGRPDPRLNDDDTPPETTEPPTTDA